MSRASMGMFYDDRESPLCILLKISIFFSETSWICFKCGPESWHCGSACYFGHFNEHLGKGNNYRKLILATPVISWCHFYPEHGAEAQLLFCLCLPLLCGVSASASLFLL